MSNQVYANGMEIACKAANGKTIAALPDVCLSPPSPPAGPVPIPYPNTAYATDTTEGSKTVQISGKEVMLKDKSYFKQSTGNEAATKSLGMGVVTHTIQGKVSFTSWSMDVKIEDENAVRHLDLTLHNEMSLPANTPTWPYLDEQSLTNPSDSCVDDIAKERAACGPLEQKYGTGRVKIAETKAVQCADTPEAKNCQQARKCMLVPYDPNLKRCCPGQQPHHIVEAHGFCRPRGVPLPSFQTPPYDLDKAPCVCAEGDRYTKEHGAFHALQGHAEARAVRKAMKQSKNPERAWSYGQAREAGARAHSKIFKGSGCSEECVKKQLDNYHEQLGLNDNTKLRTYDPRETPGQLEDWQQRQTDQVVQEMHVQLGTSLSGTPP
jgi:hypothetical protein